MGIQVCLGAMLPCSLGMAPSALVVLPTNRVTVENKRASNIMDHMPVVNIPTLGMWSAPTNPDVIAPTSAASGVPTPAPCVPVASAPWVYDRQQC